MAENMEPRGEMLLEKFKWKEARNWCYFFPTSFFFVNKKLNTKNVYIMAYSLNIEWKEGIRKKKINVYETRIFSPQFIKLNMGRAAYDCKIQLICRFLRPGCRIQLPVKKRCHFYTKTTTTYETTTLYKCTHLKKNI